MKPYQIDGSGPVVLGSLRAEGEWTTLGLQPGGFLRPHHTRCRVHFKPPLSGADAAAWREALPLGSESLKVTLGDGPLMGLFFNGFYVDAEGDDLIYGMDFGETP